MLKLYILRQARSVPRYWLEQLVTSALSWVPTLLGIGLRALCYRLILSMEGVVAIEPGVRLRYASEIALGRGTYLDQGVYIHATPGGVRIGRDCFVMHHAELHVYNFRDLPHAFISIGDRSLVGEFCVLRGQGGISIGDDVYLAPLVQVLAINHTFDDPGRPISQQPISARGIVIEDGCWIGGGAIILDGVRVGRNSVVGAGAVVTRDVAPYTVVAGNPARTIRTLAAPAASGAAPSRAAVETVIQGSRAVQSPVILER
jgi:acetyltransferase-like isoleucine patch superfamily enzyme